MAKINQNHPKWNFIKRVAQDELGAKYWTVQKWMQTGIPHKWQLELITKYKGKIIMRHMMELHDPNWEPKEKK